MTDMKISRAEYEKMQRQIAKLNALESGGVDNWDFYDESLKEWRKDGEIEEAIDFAIEEINEVLVDAEVDFPAGREAGSRIVYDDYAMRRAIRKAFTQYAEVTK